MTTPDEDKFMFLGVQLGGDGGGGWMTVLGSVTIRLRLNTREGGLDYIATATERNRHGGDSLLMKSIAYTKQGALSDLERKMHTLARVVNRANTDRKAKQKVGKDARAQVPNR